MFELDVVGDANIAHLKGAEKYSLPPNTRWLTTLSALPYAK